MVNRIWTIAVKELKQIRRDPVTLIVIFVFPILMMVLFGYALNFDVKSVQLGVYDQDKTELSREFINSLGKTEYFEIVTFYENQHQVDIALDSKQIQCAVLIPQNLSDDFYANKKVKIQYLVDGVNGNTAVVIAGYVSLATRDLSEKYVNQVLERKGLNIIKPVELKQNFWYNPELKTTPFLLLGLMGAIMITLAVVLTAVAIVREKELGTIEQINVSPLTTLELIFGKIIPYLFLSLLISGFVLIAGNIMFQVHIKGNLFLLFVATLFYLFACLSIGILVSTLADSQQVAYQMGLLISQIPSNLLSGAIFPIESMPPAVQVLTNITPAKFYLVALRAIVIRAVGIEAFWQQLVYLTIFAFICLSIAALIIFKQRR